jgi:hypothetical protein
VSGRQAILSNAGTARSMIVMDTLNIKTYTSIWLKIQRFMRLVPNPKITPREAATIAIALEASDAQDSEEKMFHLKYPIPSVIVTDERDIYIINCGHVDLGIWTEIDNQTGEIVKHSIVGRI